MSAKLIAEEGLLEGLVLTFEGGEEWILGRDPAESQMVVADPEASRKHLRIVKTAEGLQIENLSDTNPVQVNDQDLTTPRLLHHGDALKIGGSRFRYYTEIGGPEMEGLNGQEEEKPVESDTATESETQAVPVEEEEEHVEAPNDDAFERTGHDEKDLLAKVDFGLEEAGPFMLKVIRGPNNGAEFSMETGRSYVLGTAPNVSDVIFHDISVSRQHAKLTIGDDSKLLIEDLGSRNGTLVDDVKIKERVPLSQNSVVSLGTTSFIVFDRESERQTIITPLLPSIVKTLQKEDVKKEEKKPPKKAPSEAPEKLVKPLPPPPPKTNYLMRILLIVGIASMVALLGFGTSTLFKSQTVVAPEVDATADINKILTAYPSLHHSYNKENGRLLLVGHILTAIDRSQLLYQLQSLAFVKSIDDSNLIIDEYIWRETNQILNKNPIFAGISVNSPAPGRFILSGFLKTRKQAEQLNDFLAQNFRYLDRLENRVVVEEDEVNAINVQLQEKGFRDVTIEIHNGEVTLSGTMPADKAKALQEIVARIKERPAIRLIKNFVSELEAEQSIIDLTDSYNVTGSAAGGVNLSVVINGKILTKGDQLDGMVITKLSDHTILLERDGVKYKIEYNK